MTSKPNKKLLSWVSGTTIAREDSDIQTQQDASKLSFGSNNCKRRQWHPNPTRCFKVEFREQQLQEKVMKSQTLQEQVPWQLQHQGLNSYTIPPYEKHSTWTHGNAQWTDRLSPLRQCMPKASSKTSKDAIGKLSAWGCSAKIWMDDLTAAILITNPFARAPTYTHLGHRFSPTLTGMCMSHPCLSKGLRRVITPHTKLSSLHLHGTNTVTHGNPLPIVLLLSPTS